MTKLKIFEKWFKIAKKRESWFLLAFSSISLELAALFFQYGLHLTPCLLCVYQRTAILGILIAGIIGFISPTNLITRVVAIVLWIYCSFKGLVLAHELVAIQMDANMISTCSFIPNFPSWLPLHEWIPGIFMPTGDCGKDQWDFLGFSMAQWMIVVFAVYGFLSCLFLIPTIFQKESK